MTNKQNNKPKKEKTGQYRWKLKWVGLAGAVWLALLPILAVFGYQVRYQNKVYPGVRVAGVELAGMSYDQAKQSLEDRYQQFITTEVAKNEASPVVIRIENDWYGLDFSKLEMKVNYEGTAGEVWQVGRDRSVLENVQTQWQALRNGKDITPQISLDQMELETQIASIAAAVYRPIIEPSVNLTSSGLIEVQQGQPGQELDTRQLISQVRRAITQFQPQVVTVKVAVRDPRVSEEKLAQVRTRAETLRDKSLRIKAGDTTTTLTAKELVGFLGFEETVDKTKVAEYIMGLSKTVNRSPQNAAFRFVNNRVTEFKPGVNGQTLDEEASTTMLADRIKDLTIPNEAITDKELQTLKLKVAVEKPEVTIDKANSLGINTLIGLGESYFVHSIPGRVHNLSLATSRVSGYLVKPGEEFSFNQAVGDISAATGYQSAYIIKDGRTILGDGGGVCQVSTTLFRALLDAGVDITERHAHSYRVSYYEQKSPVGIDATVYSPSVDLKFVNDTPGYILIQGYVEPADFHLVFEIYGTDDGRQSEISKTRLWDQVPPPPSLYQDDPTLAPGVIKQVDWSSWGAKAAFDWKVTRGGEVLHAQTFFSRYRPWQAVFLRGV